jgi:hypothetical protein
MKRLTRIGLVVAAATFAFTTQAYAGKCFKFSGTGTGITKELAKVGADWMLGVSKAGHKAKGSGKVSYTCKQEFVLQTCTASQRGCK